MTPEFGPDGYLHVLPFHGSPVANLDQVNHWMARRVRENFAIHSVPRGMPALISAG